MSTEQDRFGKIEEVQKVTRSGDKDLVEIEEPTRAQPNKEHFDSLVNTPAAQQAQSKVAPSESIQPPAKTSLMDEVRNLNQQVDRFSKVSATEVANKADQVVGKIAEIKEKLASKDLDLKPSTHTLLQNKLSHIDENLRVAMSKAGLEYHEYDKLENKSVNPIDRFLGFLTNGQTELASLSSEINQMHLNNKEISPANMLRIQLKVGYISQEIEFFTAVLNKALESTKTIMNVQV